MNQLKRWGILSGLICLIAVPVVEAQSADPLRFLRWSVEDVRVIPRSTFTLKTGLKLGIATGSILAVSHFDRRFSREAERFTQIAPRRMRKIFHEVGNVNVIRPMSAVLFVGALTSRNVYFQDAAFTSLQSIILANLVTNGLKLAFGRSRPNTDSGPASFNPLSGNRSFPSGHATTVFAFTTPWILYYPGIASATLFTLGIGTAVVRMSDRYHWFSDVLGGALIGFGTGYVLSKRHKGLSQGPQIQLSMSGIYITWAI